RQRRPSVGSSAAIHLIPLLAAAGKLPGPARDAQRWRRVLQSRAKLAECNLRTFDGPRFTTASLLENWDGSSIATVKPHWNLAARNRVDLRAGGNGRLECGAEYRRGARPNHGARTGYDARQARRRARGFTRAQDPLRLEGTGARPDRRCRQGGRP